MDSGMKLRLAPALAATILLSGCAATAQRTEALLDLQTKASKAYEAGDCEAAVALYGRLADRFGTDTQSLLRIGNCHARSQRWTDARKAYRNALTRDPKFVKAWHNLSYVQARELEQTFVRMAGALDPAHPATAGIRRLAERVLAAFDWPLKSPATVVPVAAPRPQREQRSADQNVKQAPLAEVVPVHGSGAEATKIEPPANQSEVHGHGH